MKNNRNYKELRQLSKLKNKLYKKPTKKSDKNNFLNSKLNSKQKKNQDLIKFKKKLLWKRPKKKQS